MDLIHEVGVVKQRNDASNQSGKICFFATLSGRKIPGKHLKLGIAVKSLTGSRKVIEMLNRYGHCSNYHMIEEIETEMTYASSESQTTTPSCMQLSPEGGIGCAFDNYDCFVEIQNGKDTLHDTVGITYEVLTSTEKEPVSDPVSRKPEEIASNISDSKIDMILERNIAVDVNQPQNKTIGHKNRVESDDEHMSHLVWIMLHITRNQR